MSGLANTGAGRTFVNQFKGHFTVRTNEDDPDGVKRTNKIGKVVYERRYNSFEGYITAIAKESSEDYGYSWAVTMEANGQEYKLNFGYNGRTTMGLFLRLPNIDLAKPLTMQLYYFEEDDKSALVVYQEGHKIAPYWTRDEPNGLPELEELTVNGKKQWDSTKRMAYIEMYLDKKVKARLQKAVTERVVNEPADIDQRHPDAELYEGMDEPVNQKEVEKAIEEMEGDDLPF